MLGAIIGDIVGSRFEFNNTDRKDFDLFTLESVYTDDSVLTCATMEALMLKTKYSEAYKRFGRMFDAGYGGKFYEWLDSDNSEPYNSWGNGSAMRISPIGWAFNGTKKVLDEAKRSAEVTHNHPEGIKGAQAIALAILYARLGSPKEVVISEIESRFGYDFSLKVSEITNKFDVSCQGTIPICMAVFRETDNFEDAIRTAVSLGGDADTNASIVGALAEAYYGSIPMEMVVEAVMRLPEILLYLMERFYQKYNNEMYEKYFSDNLNKEIQKWLEHSGAEIINLATKQAEQTLDVESTPLKNELLSQNGEVNESSSLNSSRGTTGKCE